jgi:hypothetical protein
MDYSCKTVNTTGITEVYCFGSMNYLNHSLPYYSSHSFLVPICFAIYRHQLYYGCLITILLITSILNHREFFPRHTACIMIADRIYASYMTINFTLYALDRSKDNIYFWYTCLAGLVAMLCFVLAKLLDNEMYHVALHLSGTVAFVLGIQGFHVTA